MLPESAVTHPPLIKRHVRTIIACLLSIGLLILALSHLQALAIRAAGAYVHGEGLWAKAQKDAVYWLRDYITAPDEEKWRAFELAIELCLADRDARIAMQQDPPMIELARDGLLAGGNHPDDIGIMITAFLWFQREPHMQRAIAIWTEADSYLLALRELGSRVRDRLADSPTADLAGDLAELNRLNAMLNTLEIRFSSELSDGVRWLERIFFWVGITLIVFTIAIIVWIARRLFPEIDSMEADLRASEHQFRTLYDSELIGMISWGAQGQLFSANPAFLNMVGYDAGKGGPLNWREMTPPEWIDVDDLHLEQLREHGYCKPYHKDFIHRSGERVSALVAPALAPGFHDRGMAFVVDRTQERKMQENIKKLAHHDSLTGLPNRSLFDDRLDNTIARAQRHGQSFAVMFVDLDRFKPVNDQFGHVVGDVLLQKLSQRWRGVLRDCDTLARLGGDEFVLIVEDFASPECVNQIAQKLVDQLEAPFEVEGHTLSIGCSIGISFYPQHGYTRFALTRMADCAMYAAKAQTDSRIRIFDPSLLESDD